MLDIFTRIKTELNDGLKWLVLAILTLGVSYAGPFGTYDTMSWPVRFGYWGTVNVVSMVFGASCRAIALHYLGRYSYWIGALATTVLMTLTFTPTLLFIIRLWQGPVLGASALPPLSLSVAFVTALILLAVLLLQRHKARVEAKIQARAASEIEERVEEVRKTIPPIRALPRLLDRIEPELRGPLLHLTVRDHYVDITTTKGSSAILMRLSDAIAETEGFAGIQVHRSHWVSLDAVRGSVTYKGRLFLLLSNGSEVPVSRGYRAAVEQAGLLTEAPELQRQPA
tara:strand:- start:53 stop:901 length:849 start_codon:yes stop_codon:yes gene_type:complete